MIEQTKNEVVYYHHDNHSTRADWLGKMAACNEVVHYYFDSHPTKEDLMGESWPHAELVHYLMEVLKWLLRDQICVIYENFNFYRTADTYEYSLAPDVAVIKGGMHGPERSWRVGVHGPAPHVVFEIASDETWKRDLEEKPEEYAVMGVQEYYAYDPHQPLLPLSRSKRQRLFGWHRDERTGLLRACSLPSDGRLWSPHLASFLVPDGEYLRLYSLSGDLRLTEAEAEKHRAEALAEKLRALGINPDQLI